MRPDNGIRSTITDRGGTAWDYLFLKYTQGWEPRTSLHLGLEQTCRWIEKEYPAGSSG